MKSLIKSILSGVQSIFADMLGQILALFMLVLAGLSWAYFSTIYAAIPVLVVGIAIGGYIYGWAEGTGNKKPDKNKET